MLDEIPAVEKKKESPVPLSNESTEYEKQKRLCLNAIEKINENCASSSIYFEAKPEENLIKELEAKGYDWIKELA